MIESAITTTMVISSFFLFCFWFRYTCRLILTAATSQDYSTNVAQANRLAFQSVQLGLQRGTTDLNGLKEMLDLDYAVLTRLMDQADDSKVGIERRMLETYYRLTAAWYQTSSSFSPAAARSALEEMSQVVAYFANSMGECMAASSAA